MARGSCSTGRRRRFPKPAATLTTISVKDHATLAISGPAHSLATLGTARSSSNHAWAARALGVGATALTGKSLTMDGTAFAHKIDLSVATVS